MSIEPISSPYDDALDALPSGLPGGHSGSLDALLETPGEEDLFGNRQEWKYLLDPARAAALRVAIDARLEAEEFVPGRRFTLMHSIYFDSPDFKLYRRAMRSQSNLKFRLRAYATHGVEAHQDLQGYFECKIGKRNKKHKLRAMIPLTRAGDLMSQAKLGRMSMGRLSIAADQRFLRKARRVLLEYGMAPRLTVSYVREAFVDAGGHLRVTFDEGYRAARIDGAGSPLHEGRGQLDLCIIEIKFVGALPDWLAATLIAFGLPEGGVSFSKFRHGVALTYPDVAARA